jgi:hypothetical protein
VAIHATVDAGGAVALWAVLEIEGLVAGVGAMVEGME